MVFISGGGNYRQTAPLDEKFFKRCRKILYIPVGLKRNFSGYEQCWEWFCEVCRAHNFNMNDVDMCLSLEEVEDIFNYDGIYIGGASDSNWLNYLLHDSGFANKLATYLETGGNIYGGSAGGILLGQTIDLKGKSALKLLPFSILSHYSGNESLISFYFASNNHPLVILHEDSGIIYDGQTIKSVGCRPAHIYFTETQHSIMTETIIFDV